MRKTFKKLTLALTMFLLTGLPFVSANNNSHTVKAASVAASNLILKNFDSSNGLTTSEANAVLASQDGHIWVGSYGGLIKYDGKTFVNYSKSNEFGVSGIRSLYEDENGLLYIGTNDKSLYTYDKKEFKQINDQNGEKIPSIRNIAKDVYGTVYLGTSNGIYYLENNVYKHLASSNISGTVYSLTIDKNNICWGCDGDGSLFALRDGKEIFFMDFPDLGLPGSIYTVLAHENDIYVGTSIGILGKIHFNIAALISDSPSVDVYFTGSLSSINRLMFDKENKLWIASYTGCGYFDSEMNLFTDSELSGITSANDIAIDHQNNVWFASQKNGLYEAISGVFYHATGINELKNVAVNSIAYSNERYFIGTDNGLIITDTNFNKVNSTVSTNLEGIRIRDISIDSNDNAWVSTYSDQGLVCIRPNLSYFSANALSGKSTTIRVTEQLSNGTIAVGAGNGLFIITSDGSTCIKEYHSAQGLESEFILSLCELNNGIILIGTDGGGLFTLKDDVITDHHNEKGESLGVVLKCHKDNDATWVAASSSLYTYSADGIKEIDVSNFSTGSILDIFSINDKICLLENDGLYLFDKQEAITNNIQSCIRFGQSQGLVGDINANSFSLLKGSELYLCTTKGLSYVNIDSLLGKTTLPKVSVNKIIYVINDNEVTIEDLTGEVIIPKDAINIKIEYSCFNYSLEECPIYYELKGFDQSPNTIVVNGTSEFTYTNLVGGEYTFVLCTDLNNADNGNYCSVRIDKEYYWYEKTINVVLVSIAAFIVFAGLIVWLAISRVKKVEKERQRYKEITNEALLTIARTIDAKDKYTNGHSLRVAEYSTQIAKRLGIEGDELERLYYIALLHDIGKIGVPDAILNKPDKLTDEEYAIIKSHTTTGGKILENFKMVDQIADGAMGHHERYDGKGYPNGKVGEENPLVARIISVADTYDAMASNRPYRTGRTPEYCIEELEKGKGTQFDPKLAEIMIQIIKEKFNVK